MPDAPVFVLPLAAVGVADTAVAGGKGANLGELIRAGLPVPDGFVVTTRAYDLVAASLPIDEERLAERATTVSASAALRDAIARVDLPTGLRAALDSAIERLGPGPVAVRSSATAEDLPGATFAGQQDTFLDVQGPDATAEAVRRCWASLFTDRAVAYRARLGIPPQQVSIAVVVQRMVPADAAGVMFTADPVTGRRDRLVIDAAPGLGEAVVSGEITPDHVTVAEDGRVVEQRTAQAGAAPVLSSANAARLAELGRRIRDHYRRPMDIEWAFAAGTAWIVQARPMTALPPPPQRLNRAQRVLSTVLGDYLTTRPYPIDMTSWVPRGPVGMMVRIVGDVGIGGVFDQLYHETDGVVDAARIPMPRPRPRLLTAPFRLRRRAQRHPLAGWRDDHRVALFDRVVAELDAVDPAGLDWPALRSSPARVLDALEPITTLRRDYLPAAGLALLRLAVWLAVRRRIGVLPDLLQGVPTWTTRGNDELAALARIAQGDAATVRAVEAGDLAAARRDARFAQAFDAWSATYGFRETSSPILITPPTLGERPEAILATVRLLLAAAPRTTGDAPDAAARLVAAVRSPRARARLRTRIANAAEAVAFREDSHVLFTRLMPALRRALLEIGARLAAAGVLAVPEDVYHCRLDEIESLDSPTGLAAHRLADAVADRAQRRTALQAVPLLNVERPAAAPSDALVTGIPGGGGVATGPVRVIRDVAAFSLLQPGDVLVCPYTNPSWTPLFQRAAAVVVDAGGPASHAAIVAREYGLPAVMGTGDATARLRDGDIVTVDGTAGVVTAADVDVTRATIASTV